MESEPYLEPSQISTMEHFWKKKIMTKAINYFHKKSSIKDVQLGSKYASGNN